MTTWFFAFWLAQAAATAGPAVLAASADREAAAALATGRYDDAERRFRRSLRLWEVASRTRPLDLAPAHINLAEVLLYQGKLTEAEAEARRAGEATPAGRTAARIQLLLAKIEFHSGRYFEADRRQTATVELLMSQGKRDPEDIAVALNDLAMIAAARNDYRRARLIAERAAGVLRAARQAGGASYGVITGNLAWFCFQTGDLAAADPLYRESLSVLRANLGADHPHLGLIMEEHARLLRKAGRKSEAKPLDAHAKAILAASPGWPPRHTIDVRSLKK